MDAHSQEPEPRCPICLESGAAEASERARVRSNVRRFASEHFTVWRCARCRSLHCLEAVDLDHYYRGYPLSQAEVGGFVVGLFHRLQVRQLRRFGLRREHRILDYGCGAGGLVAHLRRAGHTGVVGYDRFEPRFDDPALLEDRYDAIILQDVLEHVEDPRALIDRLSTLLEPGGLLFIGTPDASEIDLADPERFLHPLHQPYHRHICSEQGLRRLMREAGFEAKRLSHRYFMDLPLPVLNLRFIHHYVALQGNTVDVSIEPIRFHRGLLTPRSVALALFGWLRPVRSELSSIFVKGA